MKKKFILVSILFLFIWFVPHVFAADPEGFTALAPIPGLTETGSAVVDSTSLTIFFNNLYKYLIGLAAILAVIEIIWGGLEIATKDSVSKQTDGKNRITQAIFGLVLVLSPVVVFSIINPSILNLSLNLTALDTASKTSAPNPPSYLTELPPEVQSICLGFSQFKTIQTPKEYYCSAVLGSGWVNTDPRCAGPDSQIDPACEGTSIPLGCQVCGLTAEDEQSKTGCKPKHIGPYLETVECTTLTYASNYNGCHNGLKPQVPACKLFDVNSKECSDSPVLMYCAGKSIDIIGYRAYFSNLWRLAIGWSEMYIMPKDATRTTAFQDGCKNDGGEVKMTGVGFLPEALSREFTLTHGCPADSGITKKSNWDSYICYPIKLSCNPPQ